MSAECSGPWCCIGEMFWFEPVLVWFGSVLVWFVSFRFVCFGPRGVLVPLGASEVLVIVNC